MAQLMEFMWMLVSVFIFVAYLIVLFHIVLDIFRDGALAGWAKAIWLIALIFLPILTALVYVIARGRGMAQRQQVAALRLQAETEEYIRHVAGKSAADQISSAKALLDSGVINRNEFERIKSLALA